MVENYKKVSYAFYDKKMVKSLIRFLARKFKYVLPFDKNETFLNEFQPLCRSVEKTKKSFVETYFGISSSSV